MLTFKMAFNFSGSSKSPVIDLDAPDISIVKIEARDIKDETGLDMFVDAPDDGGNNPEMDDMDEQYDTGDFNTGEIEGSNDGSNLSGDQSSWYQSSDKGRLQTSSNIHQG